MHTLISFDYGDKKIGLAVGNTLTQNTQELVTIRSGNAGPNWDELDLIIQEWKPDLLLVGLPLNMDGTESVISAKAKSFGEQLARRYNLAIEFEDERLSSNEADSLIRAGLSEKQGLSRKKQLKRDQIAARLILQSYLNR